MTRACLFILTLVIAGLPSAYASFPMAVGPEVTALAIAPSNSRILYVGTRYEGIFKSTDRGNSWQYLNKSTELQGIGIIVVDPLHPNILYTKTFLEPLGLYKSTDAGRSWQQINGFLNVNAVAINPQIPNNLIVASVERGLCLSEDGGKEWRPVYSGTGVYSVAYDPQDPRWVFAGTKRGILQSMDGGASWRELKTGLTYEGKPVPMKKLTVTKRAKPLLYAYGLGLMTSEDGASWQEIDGICGNYTVASSAPNRVYVNCDRFSRFDSARSSVDRSRFLVSDDYGASWRPAGKELPDSWFATAMAVAPDNPQIVFAAWQGGGVYRSTNGGKTWQSGSQGLLYPKADDNSGYLQQPPLHKAVMDGNLRRVKHLLQHHADVNEISDTQMTPLLWAAERGTPAILKALLAHGARLVASGDSQPLHYAVQANNIAMVKSLLKAGADINAQVKNDWDTPLTLSFRIHKQRSSLYATIDPEDNTQYRSANPFNPMTKLLIEKGADLHNAHVMVKAIEYGDLALVEALYRKGAVLAEHDGDGDAIDLVFNAASNCKPDIVKYLLDKGFVPKQGANDEQTHTPLGNYSCNDKLDKDRLKALDATIK